MIVEVKNGTEINPDPHTIGGQNQGGGVDAGFNKFWWNRDFINRMNEGAATYLKDHNGRVPYITYNRKWWFDVIGMYECDVHAVKNSYHYVTVEAFEGKLIWKNRSTKWQLEPSPSASNTFTTNGSPYPVSDVTVQTNSIGEITGLIYLNELYERVFWHEYIGKYRWTNSEGKSVFADVVMGGKQNKLLMKFQQEEPMKALIPYDAEHFEVKEFNNEGGNSQRIFATAERGDSSYQATLTLPDGRKFVRG